MFKPFRTRLCLLLAFACGCASIHQGDIHAQAPLVGTDGYATVVRGQSLNLRETRQDYQAKDAASSLEHLNQAVHLQRQGKSWFFKDMAVLGVIGLGLGIAAAANMRHDGYEGIATVAMTGAGIALGAVIGIPHALWAKRRALPEIQAAAKAYNDPLDAGDGAPQAVP
jgi:hypothetical protein